MHLFEQAWALALVLYHWITTDPAGVGAAVGTVTPVIVAVLQRPGLSKRTRTVIAIAAAVALGAATTLASSTITGPGDALTTMFVLYATCETFYQKLWKGSGLTDTVELATTPARYRY